MFVCYQYTQGPQGRPDGALARVAEAEGPGVDLLLEGLDDEYYQ